jgi:hypothetical protein
MVIPRKERSPNSFERISNRGSPRDLTLLVCPYECQDYFQDLINYLELDTKVQVELINSNKNLSLQVEETVEISRKAKPHRRLFAMLDSYNPSNQEMDQNEEIKQAKKIVKKHNHANKQIFRLLISNPGFPLWLLLHFKLEYFSDLPESQWPKRVEKELLEFIPNFKSAESSKEWFNLSYPYLETAIKNSQKLQLIRSIKPTPNSDIHELMAYLVKLQRRYVR